MAEKYSFCYRPGSVNQQTSVDRMRTWVLTVLAGLAVWCVLAGLVTGAVYGPAEPCDSEKCKLPNCRCSGTGIPGGFKSDEIPQIVLLTFDDAVNAHNHETFYKKIFYNKHLNPNGCSYTGTFFVSHEYTLYNKVHELYRYGNEIASHSISHNPTIEYWRHVDYDLWRKEIAGQRTILHKFSALPGNDDTAFVGGMRAPLLQIGGNDMFKMLYDEDFLYDCSMPTRKYIGKNGLWPYTLDYESKQDCQIGPCPNITLPGLWVMPMVDLKDTAGSVCAMLDTCHRPENVDVVFELLKKNFEEHYNGNRSPVGYYTHAAWFYWPHHWEGYLKFLDYLDKLDDVYVVTVQQALEWVRRPQKLSDIKNFAPWKCDSLPHADNCDYVVCNYKTTPLGSERYLHVCGTCPDKYPWLDNPHGN